MNFTLGKKGNSTSIPKVSKINLNMMNKHEVLNNSKNDTVEPTPVKKVEPAPVKKDDLSDLASHVDKNINIIKKVEENEKKQQKQQKQQKQRTANKSMFSKRYKTGGCGCGRKKA